MSGLGDCRVMCNRCGNKWFLALRTPVPARCDRCPNGQMMPTTTAPHVHYPPPARNIDPNYDWINYYGDEDRRRCKGSEDVFREAPLTWWRGQSPGFD
ncbi:hypothetical protein NA56DRAFT_705803 [Hyaloscypha hepaticicola]|uniref:Zinc-ribbon domain-containing protein n=1 Tax=Hyaloscypha hepaticicola TaxID=2082293 RepID=A0A2J6PYX4_9HELO|nr:hypothetical protein NA56DRAFT_705803 [Hyaloscypha hepaticicola]